MKVHVEMDMTPEEARAFMGLPDVAPLQQKMMEEMQARMKAAFDTGDPEAMMQAWMPLGRRQGVRAVPEISLGQRPHDGGQEGQSLIDAEDARFSPWPARRGRAGLAVVRVSGPGAGAALEALAGAASRSRAAPAVRRLSWQGAVLDQALLLWFPGPAQFHRRGCRRIPYSWRAGGARGAVRGLGGAGPAARRAGRIQPPGGGKWPLGSHPGRGGGRSGRGRNPGPAAPGAAPI